MRYYYELLGEVHLNKVQNIGRKIVDTTQNLAEALMLFSMVRLEYGFIKDCLVLE